MESNFLVLIPSIIFLLIVLIIAGINICMQSSYKYKIKNWLWKKKNNK